jgi:hypothetical protein
MKVCGILLAPHHAFGEAARRAVSPPKFAANPVPGASPLLRIFSLARDEGARPAYGAAANSA